MTDDALLMDLADCGSPETLIAAILKHRPDMPRHVPIDDIAASVGIVQIKDREMDRFEGALLANPEKTRGVIAVKVGTKPRRRRFTIGHELGHFLIRSHGASMHCTSKHMTERRRATPEQKREAEANRFSAGLLMPKPMFKKDMDALGSADVTHIRSLSDLYDVSMEASANRYVELSAERCAVLFSRDGVVRYARSSRDMAGLGVRAGDRLPANSLTALTKAIGEPTDWENLSGSIWLKSEWGQRTPPILEQCLVQANGFRLTLLCVNEAEADERDEDEALEGRWSYGFKR
jgi:Zn-dependent peptidase ImmA (M78 family)